MNGQAETREPSGCVQSAIVPTGTEKRKFIIYKVINKVNGKIYVGQTCYTLEVRKSHHIHDSKRKEPCYFHRAIRKYGAENFIWETVCLCLSKNEADTKESEFIKAFKAKVPIGYNLTDGGEGGLGFSLSKEARMKLRLVNLGKCASAETRAKMSASMKGRVCTPKTREKLRIASTGKHHSDETKAKLRKASTGNKNMVGKHLSDATKEKLSKVNTGKPGTFLGRKHTAEARAKITAAQTGKKRGPHSDEHREKIRKALQGRKIPEEQKIKLSIAATGYKHTKESIEKMRAQRIGRKHSEEAKEKMRKSWILRKQSSEYISSGHSKINPLQEVLSI